MSVSGLLVVSCEKISDDISPNDRKKTSHFVSRESAFKKVERFLPTVLLVPIIPFLLKIICSIGANPPLGPMSLPMHVSMFLILLTTVVLQ